MRKTLSLVAAGALLWNGLPAWATDTQDNPAKLQISLGQAGELTLNGLFRVRYERRDADLPEPAEDSGLDRYRSSLQLGGIWKNSAENWQVGAGLTTGPNSANTTLQTWSGETFFEKGEIMLDYAYAKHTLSEKSDVILGQQRNPYVSSWLLWDSDARPVGLSLSHDTGGVFVTTGAYDVYQAEEDVAMMYGGQAGYRSTADVCSFTAALSYYGYDDKVFEFIERPNDDYAYREGSLYADMSVPVGALQLTGYSEFFHNFGASGQVGEGVLGGELDPESENNGWVVGLKAKRNKITVEYAYAQVGADSVIAALKDSEFGSGLGSGVDVQGHLLRGGYNFTKNFGVVLTSRFYEPMTRSAEEAGYEKVADYQADVIYKF